MYEELLRKNIEDEDEDVLRQERHKLQQVKELASQFEGDVDESKQALRNEFNSRQFQEGLQHHVDSKMWGQALTRIDQPTFQAMTQPFHREQQKTTSNKHYAVKDKLLFKNFYQEVQAPLDVLHEASGVGQQARQQERERLLQQLDQKRRSEFVVMPKFLAHEPTTDLTRKKYDAYLKTGPQGVSQIINYLQEKGQGNEHVDLKNREFDEYKRLNDDRVRHGANYVYDMDAREKQDQHRQREEWLQNVQVEKLRGLDQVKTQFRQASSNILRSF